MTSDEYSLDSPERGDALRSTILNKRALRAWYVEVYRRYQDCIARTPPGIALELGSGAGFAKEMIPDLITSDVLPYPGVDRVVDATHMPFESGSLRFIGMLNVFHHIPDVAGFLAEAVRCLVPGGRVLIVDQNPGLISAPILRHAHHEPFRPDATEWAFASTGPLSGANGALAWIVFKRDRAIMQREFPELTIERYQPHSPLRYWLAGGLKRWSLLPMAAWPVATALDRILIGISEQTGSFLDIELCRR